MEKSEADPFLRADGTVDWVHWEIHPWYDNAGEIGGIILFSEVITERKRAEEQIRYQATLLQNVSDAIIASDMELTITDWPAGQRHPRDRVRRRPTRSGAPAAPGAGYLAGRSHPETQGRHTDHGPGLGRVGQG
jgi:hypothetical protein